MSLRKNQEWKAAFQEKAKTQKALGKEKKRNKRLTAGASGSAPCSETVSQQEELLSLFCGLSSQRHLTEKMGNCIIVTLKLIQLFGEQAWLHC